MPTLPPQTRFDRIRKTLMVLVIGCASVASAYQSDNLPDISAPEDQTLSPAQAQALGDSFYRSLRQRKALFTDPALSEYIQSLGNRIRSGVSSQDFTFFVVKDRAINAFATPGGYVAVNAGLVLATKTEDELASVLAHEIAHVTQKHIARLYAKSGKSMWTQIGSLAAAIALASNGETQGAVATMYAGQALQYQAIINHTRAHEKEADRIGLEYLIHAGYQGEGMVGFFRTMQDASLQEDKRFEILRTHPYSNNRLADTQSQLSRLKKTQETPASIPSDLGYQAFKARLQAKLFNYNRYLTQLSKQSKLSFKDNLTKVLLLKAQGDVQTTQSEAEKMLKQYPSNVDVQLTLADILFAQNKLKPAQELLENLYALSPHQFSIAYAWVRCLIQQKKYTSALRVLRQYEQTHTKLPPLMMHQLAECLKNTGQTALYKMHLGEYYFEIGQYDTAETQLNSALNTSDDEQSNALAEHQTASIKAILKQIREERVKALR